MAGAIRAQPLATKDRVIFLAFDPNLIRLVRQALPDYPAWLLLGKGTYNGAALLQAIGACNATGVDIDMESDFGAADVWAVKAAGYAFGAWTCDDPQEAFALAEKGVDAITANAASDLSAVVRPLVVETYFPDDTDTDGLPDEWETAYFGSPDDCTPLDDLDRDGFANIDEYRYGTDPGDPASRFVLAFANAPEGAERTVALTWPSVAGGVYSIWWSTDLAGGFELLVGGIPATPPRNVHPVAARGAVHFYRVTAALP